MCEAGQKKNISFRGTMPTMGALTLQRQCRGNREIEVGLISKPARFITWPPPTLIVERPASVKRHSWHSCSPSWRKKFSRSEPIESLRLLLNLCSPLVVWLCHLMVITRAACRYAGVTMCFTYQMKWSQVLAVLAIGLRRKMYSAWCLTLLPLPRELPRDISRWELF